MTWVSKTEAVNGDSNFLNRGKGMEIPATVKLEKGCLLSYFKYLVSK